MVRLYAFFLALFAPEGWPESVAPEYGRYQLWDTIQQMTFFVNTVISKQAVMKFHGVGDPTKTPAEAAALEMGRGLLASLIALVVSTPAMIDKYRSRPRSFRMTAELGNATGHFIEILAAIFSGVVTFLYLGPVLCTTAGGMSGAVRAVVLQHFARGGKLPPGKQPDFGDISLKESNQDKGGKVVGLAIGITLLGYIGVGNSPAEESSSLVRSGYVFAVLTVVHILGNVQAVLQLQIPAAPSPSLPDKQGAELMEVSFLRRMFLPKGFPCTVVDNYVSYRFYSLIPTALGSLKQIVTSLIFWQHVYGVGDSGRTPAEAVMIDIFMMSVDCIMGLLTGMPAVTQGLDYSKKVWFMRAQIMQRLAEVLIIAAALGPRPLFYPGIVVARTIAAFASTSNQRIGGAIPVAFMRHDSFEKKDIELIHITMSTRNQDTLVRLPSGLMAIFLLYTIVWTGKQPTLWQSLCFWGALQLIQLACDIRCYTLLNFLPSQAAQTSLAVPLLGDKPQVEQPVLQRTRSNPTEVEWEEQNDLKAELQNSYTGAAPGRGAE